jgi:pimeloyl-ACP methyl ester carboxylesterase
MRKLAIFAGCVIGLLLLAYAAGLGVYAVSSTRTWINTQPRTPEEARRSLARLGLDVEYPFASRLLLTPHGRMHYVDEGQGPALLCLHGNGRWSLECREVVRARSATGRVIAPDLIGFGLSEKPARLPEDVVAAHAIDLARLVEALDLRDVQLMATSSSAPIAVALVKRAPERVRSTVIEDGAGQSPQMSAAFASTPVLGELLAQGFGALSPGLARGPYGRVQGNWDERASSLALERALRDGAPRD